MPLADLPFGVSHIDVSVVHFEGFIVVVGGSKQGNILVPYVQAYSIPDNQWRVIHRLGRGIKLASCWLQNCTNDQKDLPSCKLFAAAGEPGDPATQLPLPPCINNVMTNTLKLVPIGWPQRLEAKNSYRNERRKFSTKGSSLRSQ